MVGDNLGEGGGMALAARLRADDNLDDPSRLHGNSHSLVRRADGRLDVVGNADACVAMLFTRRRLASRKALPVGQVERALHVAWKIAAVISQAHGRAIRQLIALNQVAAPQFD